MDITNNRGHDVSYGEPFRIQVLLDEIWYDVPCIVSKWFFPLPAYVLPDGDTHRKTYNLMMYGDLPAGIYRLVASNLSVTFEK